MASFLENYREVSQKIPFKGFRPVTFRNAEQGEGTTFQLVKFSKPDKHFSDDMEQYKYDETKDESILLIVPSSKKEAPFSTVEGYHSINGDKDYNEKVDMENWLNWSNTLKENSPVIGISNETSSKQPDGEILGAIDGDYCYNAKGAKELLDKLGKQGYRITYYQKPEVSWKRDDGYYPGDIFRRITGIAPPFRGKIYSQMPSAKDNKESNEFLTNLREGARSYYSNGQ